MMKSFITVLFLASWVSVASQVNTELKLDKRSAVSTKEYIDNMRAASWVFSYSKTGFLNPTFYQNSKDDFIAGGSTFDFSLQVRIWLFRLDGCGFYGSYKIKEPNYLATYDEKSASFSGVNIFLNFLPMPNWGKISKILVPSVGIGYQTASLNVKSKSNNPDGSLGMGGLMYKGGLQINLFKSMFIHSEYRQGVDINSNKAPQTFVIGIGFGV